MRLAMSQKDTGQIEKRAGYTDIFARNMAGLSGRTVLQIVPSLGRGSSERIVLALAAALADVGARALVAAEDGSMISELQAKGGIWLPFPAKTRNPLAMLVNVRKLAGLIRSEGVDLVHVHSRAPAWVALAATRLTHKPLVTTFHSSYGARSSAKVLYNSVMTRGDAVIVHSEYTAGQIAKAYPAAGPRMRVIGAGVDFRDFSPSLVDPERVARLRAEWGVAAHEHIVLLAARLSSLRAQKNLIEAADLLARRGLNQTKFILVGEAPVKSVGRDVEALIVAKGLQDVILRVGACADMPAAFLSAALVVVPSTEPEAFGLTSVEAQALGTPVVVSELGAVAETVLAPPDVPPEQRTGWRIAPNDPQALAEAILQGLSLGASAKDAIGMRARQHVISRFAMERMTAQTMDVYAALIR